jgi:hypothetical protein
VWRDQVLDEVGAEQGREREATRFGDLDQGIVFRIAEMKLEFASRHWESPRFWWLLGGSELPV